MLRNAQNYGAKLFIMICSFGALLCAGSFARAQTIDFVPSEPTGKITPSFTLYEDVSGDLDLSGYLAESVQQKKGKLEQDRGLFAPTLSALWFETTITNVGSKKADAVLELRPGYLEQCDVWTLQDGAPIAYHALGTQRSYEDRVLKHRDFLVPMQLTPGKPVRLIVRVQSKKTLITFSAQLYESTEFEEVDALATLLWGAFFGLVAVMGLYNLFLFFAIRNTTYLYYCVYVFSMGLGRAIERRFTAQFLSLELDVEFWIYQLHFVLALSSLALFTRSFLSLARWMPRLDRALLRLGLTFPLLALVAIIKPIPLVLGLFSVLGIVLLLMCFFGAFGRIKQGSIEARYYLTAMSFLLLSVLGFSINVLLMGAMDYDPTVWFCVGISLMVVLLSLALARQIKTLQDDNLAIQKEATENLQLRVEERTRDLRVKTLEAQEATIEAITAQEDSERLRHAAERAKEESDKLKLRAQEDAEKLRALDKEKTIFFQNVSHELRTPLTLILNPLEQASDEYADDERLALAGRNARRLLRLVNQLLEFQKLEAGKKELALTPIDIGKFIRVCGDYFFSACSSKDIDFRVVGIEEDQNDIDEVFILGEVDALEKIAFNYLSNALKFTPRGGTIELGIENVRGAQPRVRIFVRDNGPGIREEDQAKLFKVFSQVDESTTREYEGTGLGLALVKSLAQEMNAEAGVQSTVGEGSTFYVEFDVMARPHDYEDTGQFAVREWLLAEAHNKTGEEDDKKVDGWGQSGQRILVVDDLADMRTLISGTLVAQGMQVMTAANGKQGLELAMQHRPDLIVTDWMMPVMAGPDLIRAIRGEPELRATPMILLTAKSDEESKLAGTEVGADAFVGKPFNEQELVSSVRNLLALKSREREVEALNHRLTEQVLKRYLPPDLVEKIVHGDAALVQEPRSVTATILFSDLKGFTEFSSSVRAPKLARVLNEYLAAMTDVIFSHGGTIDKFIGDAIMVIFGAPTPLSSQEQADKAAQCALAMQRQMNTLQKGWREEGLPELSMRIGLHQGPVIVGNFGSEMRSDYTAVGPTVNLASRIESVCAPGGVYVSGEVCDFLPESMSEPVGNFELKGIDGKTRLYCLAE